MTAVRPDGEPAAGADGAPAERGARVPADRLAALQAGRAVAAILVVLYHANDFILPLRLYDGVTAWRGFGWGYAGVEFFFVLSGFIIAHVHRRDIGQPGRIGPFLRKRITRIYPVYWIVLTVLVLGYMALPGLVPDGLLTARGVATSYLLVPSPDRPIMPVAWTLKHEVAFYAVFALCLLNVRLGAAAFGLWMAACAVALFMPATEFPATFVLSPYNLLFAGGVATAWFHPRLPERLAAPLLAAGVCGFMAVGFSEQFLLAWPLGLRTMAYGLAAVAVIAAVTRVRFPVPRQSIFLGDASYAIYLVHLPVMNLAAVLLARLGIQHAVPPLVMFAALSALAVAAGAALHVTIERPLQTWLRRRPAAPRALPRRLFALGWLAAALIGAGPAMRAEAGAEGPVRYLSPQGDDRWSGTRADPLPDGSDGPFASLEAARDALRAAGRPGTIILRGGEYHLRATVDFDARDAGLRLIAAAGERPVIFGGPAVTGWEAAGAGRWTAPLPLGPEERLGDLFVDGRRQPAARYPNLAPDGDPRQGWLFVRPPARDEEWLGNARFGIRPGDLPPFGDPAGIVAHVTGGAMPGAQWGSDTLPVLSVDRDRGLIQTGGTSYFYTGAGSRYFLSGSEAFLDAPGEWWFDRQGGRVILIAPPGIDMRRARVSAGLLASFLRLRDAPDVTISGLTLRDGAPEGSGKYATDMRSFGAIRLERSDRARLAGNRLENLGVGIHVSESSDVTIEGNRIAHTAGNAIYFGTTYGTFGRSDRGRIIDNRIADVGEVYFETAGIWFQAASALRISGNVVERAAQFGIAGGSIWGESDAVRDVVIEENRVRDANRLTADGGGIKMTGQQSTPLDSLIRHNVVTGTDQLMARPEGGFWPARYENIREWPGPVSWAIYLDSRASGVSVLDNRVEGNVAGIGINGGWSNLIRGNAIAGGTGCAFRIDDATGRDWRPDWAAPNLVEGNVVHIDRAGGCRMHVHAPGQGPAYVRFRNNMFVDPSHPSGTWARP